MPAIHGSVLAPSAYLGATTTSPARRVKISSVGGVVQTCNRRTPSRSSLARIRVDGVVGVPPRRVSLVPANMRVRRPIGGPYEVQVQRSGRLDVGSAPSGCFSGQPSTRRSRNATRRFVRRCNVLASVRVVATTPIVLVAHHIGVASLALERLEGRHGTRARTTGSLCHALLRASSVVRSRRLRN